MKRTLVSFAAALLLPGLGAVSATAADDLQALAGKWVAERKDDQGRAFKQVLEIKRDKFTFRILRGTDETVLYAEGNVKAEELGPFKTAKFYNIRGGRDASDLQDVNDDRTVVYLPGYNELTVAANFDREREEPPMAQKYTKAPASEGAKTLVIEKIVMHKTPQAAEWYLCFDATVGDTTKRFNIPDKTWSGTENTIATNLEVPGARADQTCKFVMKLDDVAGDECTEEMDNKSTGSFTVTTSGSQDFKPEDGWSYTIHWRLK